MSGKLYGVGVGPGDPELLTLKALRVIKEADVLLVPGNEPKESIAYQIVKGAYPQIDEKKVLAIPMPMSKDPILLEKSHDYGAEKIKKELEVGKNAAFLTLGDPTVYSTYLYLHKRILEAGYETEIISGIPSFCAAAARLNTGLAEKSELIHVVPASYQIEESLKLSGTKIFMKAGKKMKLVKKQLLQSGAQAMMIENCGMPDEKIYKRPEEIPDEAGYYSLIIMKDKGE